MTKPPEICPVSGKIGVARRRFRSSEVVALYEEWLDISLSTGLKEKYFSSDVQEFECSESGMRWYEPGVLGESDFYELLQAVPWYYGSLGWDKLKAIDLLKAANVRRIFEPGCGDGLFLSECRKHGIDGFGSEINKAAINKGRANGIAIFDAAALPSDLPSHDAVVSLQTLEHTRDPVSFVKTILGDSDAKLFIIAVPCHESLLGLLSDPLVLPPHHYTAWSRRGMMTLANITGLKLEDVYYDRIGVRAFVRSVVREAPRGIVGFPRVSSKIPAAAIYLLGRLFNRRWARSGHTLIGVFRRNGA